MRSKMVKCDDLLKCVDVKYQFALVRDFDDECDDEVWSLAETKEEGLKKLKVETNAYDFDENDSYTDNFCFYLAEIVRRNSPKVSGGRIHTEISLVPIENCYSENVR